MASGQVVYREVMSLKSRNTSSAHDQWETQRQSSAGIILRSGRKKPPLSIEFISRLLFDSDCELFPGTVCIGKVAGTLSVVGSALWHCWFEATGFDMSRRWSNDVLKFILSWKRKKFSNQKSQRQGSQGRLTYYYI